MSHPIASEFALVSCQIQNIARGDGLSYQFSEKNWSFYKVFYKMCFIRIGNFYQVKEII